MHEDTERRIVLALTRTDTPWWYLAKEWNISERTLLRIAEKYGIRRRKAS